MLVIHTWKKKPKFDLWWKSFYNKKGNVVRRELYCGQQSLSFAIIYRRKKWWDSYIPLGDISLRKKYAPKEEMEAMIEAAVRDFLAKLLTPRVMSANLEEDQNERKEETRKL